MQINSRFRLTDALASSNRIQDYGTPIMNVRTHAHSVIDVTCDSRYQYVLFVEKRKIHFLGHRDDERESDRKF
jgi:hypothetical protein